MGKRLFSGIKQRIESLLDAPEPNKSEWEGKLENILARDSNIKGILVRLNELGNYDVSVKISGVFLPGRYDFEVNEAVREYNSTMDGKLMTGYFVKKKDGAISLLYWSKDLLLTS
jgi:hypothetical protein